MVGMHGSVAARFMAKVKVPVENPDDCWEWTGFVMPSGHGQMKEGLAHRVAYQVLVGPIPDGLSIDHECHNLALAKGQCEGGTSCKHRRCVNPWHLSAKTEQENNLAGGNNWTEKETCKNGHPTEQYRRRSPKGQTYCQECRRKSKETARIKTRMKRRETLRKQRSR